MTALLLRFLPHLIVAGIGLSLGALGMRQWMLAELHQVREQAAQREAAYHQQAREAEDRARKIETQLQVASDERDRTDAELLLAAQARAVALAADNRGLRDQYAAAIRRSCPAASPGAAASPDPAGAAADLYAEIVGFAREAAEAADRAIIERNSCVERYEAVRRAINAVGTDG